VIGYVLATIALIPVTPLLLIGTAQLGILQTIGLTMLSATIGATVSFFVAHYFGQMLHHTKPVERLYQFVSKYDTALSDRGVQYTALLRLSLLFPFGALNYALGLSRISYVHFIIGTIVGIFPAVVVYAVLGGAFFSQNPLIGIIAALGCLGALFISMRHSVRYMRTADVEDGEEI
jgi:uncharacterized membrane protein YdjX (TVP38/TMEM64 family)